MKRKPGRKPMPIERQKTARLEIPVTERQREILEEAYQLSSSDVSMTEYYRALLLDNALIIVKGNEAG